MPAGPHPIPSERWAPLEKRPSSFSNRGLVAPNDLRPTARGLFVVTVAGTLVLGEVGLTGEVRGIGQVETRIAEARKMGFTRCLLPQSNYKRLTNTGDMSISGIRTVTEGIETLF